MNSSRIFTLLFIIGFMAFPPARAEINSIDFLGQTNLLKFVSSGNYEAAKAILKEGADPNIANALLKQTPLMVACGNRADDMVESLLMHGAKPDLIDAAGSTALIYAADNNCIRCVELLIKSGANTEIVNSAGQTAALRATSHKNQEILDLLSAHSIKKEKATPEISLDSSTTSNSKQNKEDHGFFSGLGNGFAIHFRWIATLVIKDLELYHAGSGVAYIIGFVLGVMALFFVTLATNNKILGNAVIFSIPIGFIIFVLNSFGTNIPFWDTTLAGGFVLSLIGRKATRGKLGDNP
ncbi:ankyrin repeat domain-containing protein [uncultured Thiodictyon sp.]|uniref:ankyrin repeat domain-containing protein n=1 Tax=uncultured Thiodictyon sp. TaxID=1846217 RepID=UPI0025F69BA5|nr:ankyrin repeat domain-containing protein [uncultured Thiodictyon sp.]